MTSLIVSRWRQSFTEARTTLHNERRSRSSSNARFPNVVEDIQGVIDTDWRLTLHEILPQLPQNVQISHASLISNLSASIKREFKISSTHDFRSGQRTEI